MMCVPCDSSSSTSSSCSGGLHGPKPEEPWGWAWCVCAYDQRELRWCPKADEIQVRCVAHVEGKMPCLQQDSSWCCDAGVFSGVDLLQFPTAGSAPLHPHQRDWGFPPLLRASNGSQGHSEISLTPVVTPGTGRRGGQSALMPGGCVS